MVTIGEKLRDSTAVRPRLEAPRTDLIAYMAILGAAGGNILDAAHSDLARKAADRTQRMLEKAAVSGGTTTDPSFAAPLADFRGASASFLEGQPAYSAFDKILPDMRRAPLHSRAVIATGAVTGYVVEEAAPVPPTRLSFDEVQLRERHAIGEVILSAEVLRLTPTEGQALLAVGVRSALGRAVDEDLLTITDFATCPEVIGAGVSAGQIIAAVSELLADGMQLTARSKIKALLHPSAMAALALDATTVPAQNLGIGGGTLAGVEFIPTDAARTDVITVVDCAAVFANGGLVTASVARHADVQQSDDPSVADFQVTSLWQNSLIAARASRYYGFARSSDTCVGIISSLGSV